jgi:ribonuclease P protein component
MTGSGFESAECDEPGAVAAARMKKRADFVRTAKGSRFHTRAFSMQAMTREQAGPPRIGLTVTRKAGGAVERNRMRRRLREALRLGAALSARADHDYVIVARHDLLSEPFDDLKADLARAFEKIRRPRQREGTPPSSGRS